jgi:UDP-2,3-diacylglucosamine pyrophosphatase LpxH
MPTATAYNPPTFDLAYVISDLHLGGGDFSVQMFASAPQFAAFIDHVLAALAQMRKKRKQARVLLVINGDFVDFLAEPGATIFNLDRSAVMVGELFARAPFDAVLQSLQEFIKAEGTHLVITLGNHDVELALPDTGRALVQLLTDNISDLEGKVELCFDGWGYRFEVAGRRALCLHGNEADEYNFTRYDELDRIIQDLHLFGHSSFGATWRPSAGSWFVINAVNPVKKNYPFVDILKPETSVMPTVLAVLDPTKVAYVRELDSMRREAKRNDAARPASQRRMLSATAAELAIASVPFGRSAPGLSEAAIMERAEHALADGRIDELIHLPVDGEMLGWVSDTLRWVEDRALALKDQASAVISAGAQELQIQGLRTLLPPMLSDEPNDVGALSDADLAINRGVRAGYDVIFAGHTHMRRIAQRPGTTGLYVNTGTWAGLMGLSRSEVAAPAFLQTYQALRSGSRQALFDAKLVRQECTIARVSVEDGRQNVVVTLGGVNESTAVQFPKEMTRPLG